MAYSVVGSHQKGMCFIYCAAKRPQPVLIFDKSNTPEIQIEQGKQTIYRTENYLLNQDSIVRTTETLRPKFYLLQPRS